MSATARRWFTAAADWIFPPVCEVCASPLTDGERHVCLSCLASLPRTDCHLSPEANDIHHRVSDHHVLLHRAAAMFHYYRSAPSTNLILSAKYRGRPAIMGYLAEVFAAEIAPSGFFDGIDVIAPVPVHWTRRITRGYNQTEYLARGLSRATGIAVDTRLLTLPERHASQTRRGALARAANTAGTYAAGPSAEALRGRGAHILVVDDIITTGSTIRDCLRAIYEALPDCRCSVAALGLAHLH